jgi:hypothetical protein
LVTSIPSIIIWPELLDGATTDARERHRNAIGYFNELLREVRVSQRSRQSDDDVSLHAQETPTYWVDGVRCELSLNVSLSLWPDNDDNNKETDMSSRRVNVEALRMLGLSTAELESARDQIARHQREDDENGGGDLFDPIFKQISATSDALDDSDTEAAQSALARIGVLVSKLRDATNGGGMTTGRAFGGDTNGTDDVPGSVGGRPVAWASKHARIAR